MMKYLPVMAIAFVLLNIPAPAMANELEECRAQIRTAETILARLKDKADVPADLPLWRMNPKAASGYVASAKREFSLGNVIACEMQIREALKRLAVAL